MYSFLETLGVFLKVLEQNYLVLSVPDSAFIIVTMRLCFQISVKIMVVVLSLLLCHGILFRFLCLGIMQKNFVNWGGRGGQTGVFWLKQSFFSKMREEQKSVKVKICSCYCCEGLLGFAGRLNVFPDGQCFPQLFACFTLIVLPRVVK